MLRKHTFDLNQFYWMSRHFVWLIPLTNLLIFLVLGLAWRLVVPLLAPPRPLAGCAVALRLDSAPAALGRLPPHLRPGRVPSRAGDRRPAGPDPGAPCRRVPPLRHDQLSRPGGHHPAPGRFGLGWRLAQGTGRGGAAAAAARLTQRAVDRAGYGGRGTLEPPRLRPTHQPDARRPGAARGPVRPGAGDLVMDLAVPRQLLHRAVASRAVRRLAHAAGCDPSHSGGVPGIARLRDGRIRRQHVLLRGRHGAGPRLHASTGITSSPSSAPSSRRRWSTGPWRGCARSITSSESARHSSFLPT